MFRHRTARRTVAMLGVAALALAACTGDEEEQFEGTLEVGAVLPQTGELSFLGPAQVAGLELAQGDINAAGGVWGSDVTLEVHDEGDASDEEVVTASADALVAAGVDAVVGAVATDRTLRVIEPLRDAGILQVSPGSPGIVLDEHPARDYLLRTRPSDVVQGQALGQELVRDGYESVAIVARDDPYGQGLAAQVRQAYQDAAEQQAQADAAATPTPGATPEATPTAEPTEEVEVDAEVVAEVSYDPQQSDFDAAVTDLEDADPDAVVIISFEEGTELMTALDGAGLAPADDTQWYLVNGNLADYSDELPEGTLEGAKATAPAPAAVPEEFRDRLEEHTADLPDQAYGAEAYDALVLLALGAVEANTDDPDAIREAMISVSRGPGTACGGFASCLAVLDQGDEINYQGPSGVVDWNDSGDPQQGTVGIFEYGADNTYQRSRLVPAGL